MTEATRKEWPSRSALLAIALLVGAMAWLAYHSGLISFWLRSEEYGHAPLVLAVLAYLVYTWRHDLPRAVPPSWRVALAAIAPLLVLLLGALAGIVQLEMYALWAFGVVAIYAFGGWPLVRALAIPALIAFMVIPLPNPVEVALTARLQLISSELGVWFIRLFGGVVHLQGNIIDMGSVQLLVAEACVGLRYLYPLMSLGAIGAYLLNVPLWARLILFLSTIPITLLLNSFRIGVTGILVEHWGTAHTEGFLHFFEGWVVFVLALLMLVGLAWITVKLLPGSKGLFQAMDFGPPRAAETDRVGGDAVALRASPVAALAIVAIVASAMAQLLALREEVIPERYPLAEFPVQIGDWWAREYRLPALVEAVAGATDYYYADYAQPGDSGINLYVSYYETQRGGKIPHSPRVCIPGDGWEIVSHRRVTLTDHGGEPFRVNRLITAKGDQTMLAYYWLKQGERMYHRETVARLDLLRFSALERRTDGALVRLVADVDADGGMEVVEARLRHFARELTAVLPRYVPD